VSVSLPLRTWSLQEGARQTSLQTPLAQSEFSVHARPAVQGAQSGPPQSVSVSLPFRFPSSQVGSVQKPASLQKPVEQSRFSRHIRFTAQGSQSGPPQSVSVSSPLRVPSVHVAGGMQRKSSEQIREEQSPFSRQVFPFAQGAQSGPPQSVSVSSPLRVPSEQEGSMIGEPGRPALSNVQDANRKETQQGRNTKGKIFLMVNSDPAGGWRTARSTFNETLVAKAKFCK